MEWNDGRTCVVAFVAGHDDTEILVELTEVNSVLNTRSLDRGLCVQRFFVSLPESIASALDLSAIATVPSSSLGNDLCHSCSAVSFSTPLG